MIQDKTDRTTRKKAAAPRRRGAVRDHVLAELRRGLMVGAFVPGQVMSLRKLATRFQTSPMPVREALTELFAANALEELPNRSVRVPLMSPGRLKELFRVREHLEGLAAKDACRKCTPALIDALERINRKLRQAIAARTIEAALAANQEFHFTLYRAAESEVLMPLIESLWLQSGPTMYFSLLAPGAPWDASAHAEILRALRAGDAAAVHRALSQDIRAGGRHLFKGAFLTATNGLAAFRVELGTAP
jgi:DNA-binding GntR family transcriptional regulator